MNPSNILQQARKYIGQHEVSGSQDNPFIRDCFRHTTLGAQHDEVAWCAAFMCRILEELGLKSTRSAAAVSYASFGNHAPLAPGSIVVFRWASGDHHVTLVDHVVSDQIVACCGGNQNNRVQVSNYERRFIMAVRLPSEIKP
jgi:uncharacterized protein (TIGR02594 family)